MSNKEEDIAPSTMARRYIADLEADEAARFLGFDSDNIVIDGVQYKIETGQLQQWGYDPERTLRLQATDEQETTFGIHLSEDLFQNLPVFEARPKSPEWTGPGALGLLTPENEAAHEAYNLKQEEHKALMHRIALQESSIKTKFQQSIIDAVEQHKENPSATVPNDVTSEIQKYIASKYKETAAYQAETKRQINDIKGRPFPAHDGLQDAFNNQKILAGFAFFGGKINSIKKGITSKKIEVEPAYDRHSIEERVKAFFEYLCPDCHISLSNGRRNGQGGYSQDIAFEYPIADAVLEWMNNHKADFEKTWKHHQEQRYIESANVLGRIVYSLQKSWGGKDATTTSVTSPAGKWCSSTLEHNR